MLRSMTLVQKLVEMQRSKGRKLGYEDIKHYQKIVVALKETSRLMTEIDQCIPAWPIT
jgi:hypothetical protein